MNKESCSSLVFIKFANGESFGVCVCGAGSVKKKNVFAVHMYPYNTYYENTVEESEKNFPP